MIKGNGQIQESFAHNQVDAHPIHQLDGQQQTQTNGNSKVYIIDALLDIALSTPSVAMFDVRYAASECIQAYFHKHTPIRRHFLQRAIDGHTAGEDETSNVISILVQGSRSSSNADPYRTWFAAQLCQQLIFDDSEAKSMVKAISEGDAENGEEVVTCIQAMTGNLVEALQAENEDRVPVAYFIVLCIWLFEDVDAVNDLLTEGNVLQSLIQSASRDGRDREITKGLSAVLLGIIYEFSTKDSPIPRRKLQPLLISGLGREHYISRLTRLRQLPLIRDFEVLPQGLASADDGGLPEVYFDQLFVNFMKDNFSRLIRAIDRDPGIEVARVTEGIDRDLVDSLQGQIKDKSEALEKSQGEIMSLQGKLGQEQADNRRSQDRFTSELARIKNINEALQRSHDDDMERLRAEHTTDRQSLTTSHRQRVEDLEGRVRSGNDASEHRAAALEAKHSTNLQQLRDGHDEERNRLEEQHRASLTSLEERIKEHELSSNMSRDSADKLRQLNEMLTKRIKMRDEQLEGKTADKALLEEDIESHVVRTRSLEDQVKELKRQVKDLHDKIQESGREQTALQVQLNAKEEARSAAQTELDDLLMILGDLEEKSRRDKERLKELGAATSDDEDDDEDVSEADKDDESDNEASELEAEGIQADGNAGEDSDVPNGDTEHEAPKDGSEDPGAASDASSDDTDVPSSPVENDKGHVRESSVD